MAYTALLDACVLYPNMLRDLLLRLAVTDLYRAKWSADIHDEWMRSLAANRPDIPPEHITRVRNLMDENVRDALVEDYASLVPGLTLPDPKDRHVLAAAIVGRADVIVTFNLREFPADLPSASRLSTRTNSCATSSTWRRIWSARSCANFAPASGIRRAQSTDISPPSRSTTSSTSPRHSARGRPQSDHGNLRQVGPTFDPGPLQEYACTAHSPQPAGPPLKYVHPSPHSSTRQSIDEMLGTKLRALFQREHGRDLFDLWHAWRMSRSGQSRHIVDPERVGRAFRHYLQQEDSASFSAADAATELDRRMHSKKFLSDMNDYLPAACAYDPLEAAEEFRRVFLPHL